MRNQRIKGLDSESAKAGVPPDKEERETRELVDDATAKPPNCGIDGGVRSEISSFEFSGFIQGHSSFEVTILTREEC